MSSITSHPTVTKRDGRIEEFTVQKVKAVIAWASQGLEVNPLALEASVEDFIYDGITTEKIHEFIIDKAQTLASAQDPDWVVVAGRLLTMKRWKETGAYQISFKEHLQRMVAKGYYVPEVLTLYTDTEIERLGQIIEQERDLEHSFGSVITAEKKYLLPGECIQQMFMVQAMLIFQKKELDDVIYLYDKLSRRKISLATPWLANLRSGGNIASCFIIDVADDLGNISQSWARAGAISRMGGGLGIFLGRLRAQGASIAGRPNSAKSVNVCAKIFNDIAVYVDQGGKRVGAFTVALPVWHNDIMDFLDIQAETGDQRQRAHDIFPQVTTPDLFWKIEQENGDWYTFCPTEAKALGLDLNTVYGEKWEERYLKLVQAAQAGKLTVYTKHKAKDIFKKMLRTQFNSGLPYVFFTDTVNRANPNKHVGIIPCSNLCVESYSVTDPELWSHTCNLASIVVGRIDSLMEARDLAYLLTEVLNAGRILTKHPTECSERHVSEFATIGIGIQGVHDYLARNHLSYDNTKELTALAEAIQYGAVEASIDCVHDYGVFGAFEHSDWYNGDMTKRFKKHSVLSDDWLDWDRLQTKIDLFGIANSQLTSPAPNTSTSVFMDAAAGPMPVYSPFFREDNDNGKYPVACMYLKENPLSYSRKFSVYDQQVLVNAVAALQKFVDTGISAEYLLDHNKPDFNAKQLADLYRHAWKQGTKTVYYIRHIKRGKTVEDLLGIKEDSCAGCSG